MVYKARKIQYCNDCEYFIDLVCHNPKHPVNYVATIDMRYDGEIYQYTDRKCWIIPDKCLLPNWEKEEENENTN